MFRKKLLIGVSLILVALLAFGCSPVDKAKNGADTEAPKAEAPKAEAKEVVLKAVSAWPEKIQDNAGLKKLIEKVNEKGKGKVKIEWVGGPEVVATNELINAVKGGTVDIGWLAAAYTVSNVPVANAIKLSKMTPEEERANGVYDLWNEIFEKQTNAHYLGKGMPGVQFHLYTTKEVKKISDLKGKAIRVTASYKDFVAALGASPVMIAPGEVYTALERGVADGYGWVNFGISDWGWEALTKAVIDPGFYQVDTMGLVNLTKWNNLSDDVKKIINDAMIEVEKEMPAYYQDLYKKDRELLASKGIKVLKLSDDEAKQYLDMAYKSVWDEVLKTAPDYAQKVKTALKQ